MSRIIELIVALVILVITILSEWKVDTMNLIKLDFSNKVWLLGLIAIILFISIFNRAGEYGTDITGQLLVGVFICLLIDFITKTFSEKNYLENFLLNLSLLVYLITIKTYFVIYLI